MNKPTSPRVATAVAAFVLVSTLTTAAFAQEEAEPAAPPIVEVLQLEAEKLEPFVESDLAGDFLGATGRLPEAPARTLMRDPENRRQYYSEQAAAELPAAERDALEPVELGPERYYTTRYGSPLAYCRALDIAGKHGLKSFKGKRVVDYGYGTIGHLRLMALNGAEAVGVDVDPFLTALYSQPGDQGKVGRGKGKVRLIEGYWPGDVAKDVGGGYDLFLSKNTLKRGYVHPEREADPSRLLKLGVDDTAYVQAMFDALAPGGLAVVYNLSPKQAPPDEPYIPWADGRFPFARDLVESIGFEVLEFDVEDNVPARKMARLLGWDASGMDIDSSLFGHYTVLRKPR